MKKRWYLMVRFKDLYEDHKVWYWNDTYYSDCVEHPFEDKAKCKNWIEQLKQQAKWRGRDIKSITLHWTS